jgi:alpha-galactosidase
MGAVVETNAIFRTDEVTPVMAGEIPVSIYPLVSKICSEQEAVSDAIAKRDIEAIFNAFVSDPLVSCSMADARKMFDEMVENTKAYLTDYNL